MVYSKLYQYIHMAWCLVVWSSVDLVFSLSCVLMLEFCSWVATVVSTVGGAVKGHCPRVCLSHLPFHPPMVRPLSCSDLDGSSDLSMLSTDDQNALVKHIGPSTPTSTRLLAVILCESVCVCALFSGGMSAI